MHTYINYDLRITQMGEDYHLRADCPLAGQETGLCTMPFSEEEIQGILWQNMALSPKEIGRRLYDAIFQKNIGIHLQTCLSIAKSQKDNLRIRLHLNESSQLALFPWEYLYDPTRDDFFALSIQTPIVRYLDMSIGESSMQVEEPLHILIMIADPVDLQPRLDVEREWVLLRSAFQDLEGAQKIRLHRLPTANKLELQRYLRGNRIDIFHFIGHSYFDEQDGEGSLIFEDNQRQAEPISTDTLARLLKDKMPRLVYLNSCDTAQTGPYDPLTGTAQKLVQHGIPAVVAMQSAIQDDKAIQIAHEFYLALTDGYPVDAALVEGRKAVFNNDGLNQWGTPVLFMRAPDGILWDQQKSSQAVKLENAFSDSSQHPLISGMEEYERVTQLPPPENSPSDKADRSPVYSWARLRIIALWMLGLIAFLAIMIVVSLNFEYFKTAVTFNCTQVSGISELECKALVALYENTGGPNWSDNRGWLETDTPCNWHGVNCVNEYVFQIDLMGKEDQPFGLTGNLPPEIGDLVNLYSLNLYRNELSTVPAEIGKLSKLEHLDFNHNKLISLPGEIGDLPELVSLHIGRNSLESVPTELGKLSQLEKLWVEENQLDALPAEIGSLDKLTKLNLSNNNLKTLPTEISNLSRLEELYLSNNEFRTWPAEINTLSNLTDLNLSDNLLKTLPAEIGGFSKLALLNLNDNELSKLPTEIGGLSSLNELYLYRNEFSTWPAEINTLFNLMDLDLTDNLLKTLPAEIDSLSSLEGLYLNGNRLQTLPAEVGKLLRLEELVLYDNKLRTLPVGIGKLSNLKVLDISLNRLTELPAEIGNLTNLSYLYPDWNHLSTLPATFVKLTNVEDLNLEGNHLIVTDPGLLGWMNARDPDWADNQTPK